MSNKGSSFFQGKMSLAYTFKILYKNKLDFDVFILETCLCAKRNENKSIGNQPNGIKIRIIPILVNKLAL